MTRAAQLLMEGKLLAVPTETVYGLAADASNPAAIAQIFTAKGRPANHPLIVHIAHPKEMLDWATEIPAVAYRLADEFWPGALTLLLKKADHVNPIVTGGQPTIALRIPAHPVMQALLQMTKLGLAAPSANPYQQVSPTQAKHVMAGLKGKIDAVLDGGRCSIGLESTILDLTQTQPRILRSGPITAEAITQCLGCYVEQPQQHDVAISGNKRQHYQPRKPLHLVDTEQFMDRLNQSHERIALVVYSEHLKTALAHLSADLPAATNTTSLLIYRPTSSAKQDYAHALYSTLHELDTLAIDAIWIERPPKTSEWNDVNDRLARAAYRS